MITAWTFPGQGSQSAGMGRQLLHDFPRARAILSMAEELSGLPLNELRERGHTNDLRMPSIAEPLITAINIGYVDLLTTFGMRPDVVAGYSAGEIAAYYSCGVLDLETALKISVIRGKLFEKFTSSDHRMVAVSGVSLDKVIATIEVVLGADSEVYVAGNNAAYHTTIVGEEAEVLQVEAQLIRNGAETSCINVGGLWHTQHLENASAKLHSQFNRLPFSDPLIPVYTSLSGDRQEDADTLRHDLAYGVSRPVQWQSIIEDFVDQGVKRFIECGSGRVLFGLARWNRIDTDEFHSFCVEDRYGGLRPLKKFAIEEVTRKEG